MTASLSGIIFVSHETGEHANMITLRQHWHIRVTTRAAVWVVLQTERFTGIVLSTLPVAGQTGLNHHRQTMSCGNIYILPHQNWKILQVIYTVLS